MGDVVALRSNDGGRPFTRREIARIRALTTPPPVLDATHNRSGFLDSHRRLDELEAIFTNAGRTRGPRVWELAEEDHHDPAAAFAEEMAPEHPV